MDDTSPERPGLDRRAIPQRTTSWATHAADLLHRAGATPDSISVASVVAALVGAAALVASAAPGAPRAVLLVLAAFCAPLRLLCNMLDGMLAVEKGGGSAVGDLFNEVPDRLADLVLLAAAGYACAGLATRGGADVGVLLGWVAAAAAVLTAYVRALGASYGLGQIFDGPMSKPRRMWVLVLGCLFSLVEPLFGWPRGVVLAVALAVIAVGSIATVVVRLRRIAAALVARAGSAS